MSDDGVLLLSLFRREQSKHGHNGCECNECVKDMSTALSTFLEMNTMGLQYSWCSEGASGRFMQPKEIFIRMFPWQFYLGTEVTKEEDGDVIIVRIARKPFSDQFLRYLEMEGVKSNEKKSKD